MLERHIDIYGRSTPTDGRRRSAHASGGNLKSAKDTCSTKGSQEPTEASQASTSMPAHAAALTLAAAARR